NFGIGTHSIQFSAADFSGNQSTTVSYLLIQDTTPPVVTPPAPITVESDARGGALAANAAIAAFLASATAVDTIDGSLPASAIDGLGFYPFGLTTIHFQAVDAHGNV